MVVVNCPKCGHVFAALGPPVAPVLLCPACGQALRLHPRPVPTGPSSLVHRPSSRHARRIAAALLAFAALLTGLVVYKAADAWLSASADLKLAAPPKRPPEAPPWPSRSAYEYQRDLARRAGRPRPLSPDELFAAASPAVVRVLVQDAEHRPVGQGSGFLVSRDGWVVTNWHVIALGSSATILLENYTELPVEGVAAIDREGDLALLKAEGRDLPCLLLATGLPPRIGGKVFTIGSPQGLVNTLSEGLISGHRIENGLSVLQTTAPMSHGSSGGPLLTAEGWVVGVGSRIRAGGQNLNFAVPAERIRDLLLKQGTIVPLANLHGQGLDGPLLAQLDRAWEAIDRQDWQEARQILSRLAAAHGDNPHVWFAWGDLCRKTGLYKPAIEAFEAALKLKPDYADACCDLAATYLDQKTLAEILGEHHRTEELDALAKQAFLKAAELDPAGRTGRSARAALARHWPREFPRDGQAP